MSGPEHSTDNLQSLLRERGGLEELARELGQFPPEPRGLTDAQFHSLVLHVRAIIVLLGIIAGILLAIVWMYL